MEYRSLKDKNNSVIMCKCAYLSTGGKPAIFLTTRLAHNPVHCISCLIHVFCTGDIFLLCNVGSNVYPTPVYAVTHGGSHYRDKKVIELQYCCHRCCI